MYYKLNNLVLNILEYEIIVIRYRAKEFVELRVRKLLS